MPDQLPALRAYQRTKSSGLIADGCAEVAELRTRVLGCRHLSTTYRQILYGIYVGWRSN